MTTRRGFALGAALAVLLVAGAALASEPHPASSASEAVVYSVTLNDALFPISAGYLKDALAKANEGGAALFILKLDTPGGLVSTVEEMVRDITSSKAPVVVFVNGSKAASGGFFLTIAADVAVMAPGTRIGAAHPVLLPILPTGGGAAVDPTLMTKAENDLAAYARSLASNRGRNEKLAEEVVRKSSSFTEREALKLHLIDYVCRDENEILSLLDGKSIRRFDGTTQTLRLSRVRIVPLDMSTRERLLGVLADPTLAIFLLFGGIVGLYIEFTHPGMIAPGVIGAICLILFALAAQILPMNWIGVALVVAGIVMFLLELKVPSYGTLTVGGVACLVLGALMLFKNEPGMPEVAVARWTIVSIAGSAALIMAILTTLIVRVSRLKVTTGSAGLVGERGTALTDVGSEGRVFVHGEYWNARAARPIQKGANVRVTRVRDLVLDVEESS
ncbi:MAG TPA: nodulation protein NfeD [Candidatus Dormibacteraeota bacterium]|nr:nodulation protein NfeD [Candidatus Dormibacteraeota bacterium]